MKYYKVGYNTSYTSVTQLVYVKAIDELDLFTLLHNFESDKFTKYKLSKLDIKLLDEISKEEFDKVENISYYSSDIKF